MFKNEIFPGKQETIKLCNRVLANTKEAGEEVEQECRNKMALLYFASNLNPEAKFENEFATYILGASKKLDGQCGFDLLEAAVNYMHGVGNKDVAKAIEFIRAF